MSVKPKPNVFHHPVKAEIRASQTLKEPNVFHHQVEAKI